MRRVDPESTIGIEGFDTQVVGKDKYDVGFILFGMPL